MFPSPASGSGGPERGSSARGAAHPYQDAVPPPPPSSSGLPPPPPQIFSPYSGHANLESDRRRPDRRGGEGNGPTLSAFDDDGANEGDCVQFGEEDRMLLRLLYHQQQALQVQLNTMTEWMQQVHHRLAAVERLVRTSRSAAPTAAPLSASSPSASPAAPASAGTVARGGGRANAVQPLSRSASAMEGYAPMVHPQLHSNSRPGGRAEPSSMAEAPLAHLPGPGSAYSGQSHPASSALAVSSVLEGSRACTPPSEQTRHHMSAVGPSSAVPSTTRSYESALAAPWDPHNASQQSLNAAVHSRTSSSHTSALGRRANPLLNSSGLKSKLQAPQPLPQQQQQQHSQQLSRLEASSLSGVGQTSSASTFEPVPPPPPAQPQQPRQPPVVSPPTTAPLNAADAVVPPYRRVSSDYTSAMLTRQPLSRVQATAAAAAATRHAPPTSTLADVATEGREATLPPPSQRPASRGSSSGGGANTGVHNSSRGGPPNTDETATEAVTAAPAAASPPAVHADPAAGPSGEGGGRGRQEAAPRRTPAVAAAARALDDDDLSDGYGSYESRMYMKKLGLL